MWWKETRWMHLTLFLMMSAALIVVKVAGVAPTRTTVVLAVLALLFLALAVIAFWKSAATDRDVLWALADGEVKGSDVPKKILAKTSGCRAISIGRLYTLLYRLEHRGLVRGRWDESIEQRGKARPRLYQLTPEGRRFLG